MGHGAPAYGVAPLAPTKAGDYLLPVTLYAAYGTNLDPARMGERCPHSPLRTTGWLTGLAAHVRRRGPRLGRRPVHDRRGPDRAGLRGRLRRHREDESALDGWEAADTGLYRKTKVRVSTLTGEMLVWTYVLDAYEGGLPSASYLGVLADAAEAADAPADYVAALRARPCRSTGL